MSAVVNLAVPIRMDVDKNAGCLRLAPFLLHGNECGDKATRPYLVEQRRQQLKTVIREAKLPISASQLCLKR